MNSERETSHGGNKKHIDRTCQSAEVNERWRGVGEEEGKGGGDLPSGQQGGKQQEETGFNQTLSRSVCSE